MIYSIFSALIGFLIACWCAPSIQSIGTKIFFGFIMFLWIGASVIVAILHEQKMKKRMEDLEKINKQFFKWADSTTRTVNGLVQASEEIYNRIKEGS